MKALVTGGSGFLGQKLAKALLAAGHEVTVLVRKVPEKKDSQLKYAQGDLGDEASLLNACKGQDWVFHTAGMISYNPAKAAQMVNTNVHGTRAIATAAWKAGVKRFVHTSSTAAIGINENPDQPMNEAMAFNAGRLGLAYFTTKYEAEQEVLKLVKEGLDAVIVNPGSLLGPGDTRRYEKGYAGLVYKYKPPVLFHGGINFVDVDDVVKGHLLAVVKGRKGERYLLGGENLSYGQLIQRINSIIGRPSPSIYVPIWAMGFLAFCLKLLNLMGIDIHMTPELVRQVSSWYLYVDSSKAQKELGYSAKPIDESIRTTLDWLKEMKRI